MSTDENNYDRINDYGSVRISLASPHDIRSWSFGEVKEPETINFRTYRPEKDGLFCERIFGPEKDWECACGKYRGMKYKGIICDRCGVKVTHSRVRRKRMGHIELAAPVVHIWFFKAMPSRLGTLLDMKTTSLEKIIYFQDYVVVEPGDTPLKERQLLTEEDFRKARDQYGDAFEADMGAEAVKKLLERLNLVDLSKQLRTKLEDEMKKDKPSKQKLRDLVKRLKVVEALRDSGIGGPQNKPEWMVLECIPVIPPDLRPLVLLDSGNFATSDLNDLYRRIINRNNRLKKVVDLNAPEVIIRNRKRELQQSVDALFDNNRCKQPVLGSSNRPLKSLTDMIKGKQGRFRENLLGKRVDYSGRAVMIPDPKLKLHQCGLPRRIALELYQPFIIRRLKELGHADTIKSAKKMLERKDDQVWDILEEVVKDCPILLNRMPTLHRMGIQAFEPVLTDEKAIRIPPLVCSAMHAHFQGGQLVAHLPVSIEATVEARVLLMPHNNLFDPANGKPLLAPTEDMILGCYYLTASRGQTDEKVEAGDDMVFANPGELFLAHSAGRLGVHARVKLRLPIDKRVIGEVRIGEEKTRVDEVPRRPNERVNTTVGRVLFNDILHPRMDFYDLPMTGKNLSRIIADCYQGLGRRETIDLLDRMKDLGFRESTKSGLSFATDDLKTPINKKSVIRDMKKKIEKVQRDYQKGIITDVERYNMVIDEWTYAREKITEQMMRDLATDRREGKPYLNPIYLMIGAGLRTGLERICQLAGMWGFLADPLCHPFEPPVWDSLREGLSLLDYFRSARAAHWGHWNRAGRTRDAGYLMRRLIDVAHSVVVTEDDCGDTEGIVVGKPQREQGDPRPLEVMVRGRVSLKDVRTVSGGCIVRAGELITPFTADLLAREDVDRVQVRSPQTCRAPLGVCQLCYGMDLTTGKLVEKGTAVGVLAAQSVGERSTQLTLDSPQRTAAAANTVTEDVIRARGRGQVRIQKIGGEPPSKSNDSDDEEDKSNDDRGDTPRVRIGRRLCIVCGKRVIQSFQIPRGAILLVQKGQHVKRGQALCLLEGPQDITVRLPRLIEIFEACEPREAAVLVEVSGILRLENTRRGKRDVQVLSVDSNNKLTGSAYCCRVPAGALLKSNEERVYQGEPLTKGPLSPRDLLRLRGLKETQCHLIRELQNMYGRLDVDDRHFEVIVAEMLRKRMVESAGDSRLVPGSIIDRRTLQHEEERLRGSMKITDRGDSEWDVGKIVSRQDFDQEQDRQKETGGAPPVAEVAVLPTTSCVLLGIRQVAQGSESFLSGASFENSVQILVEAAIAGKVDHLLGLKENVLMGRLIPAGTGFHDC